MLIETRDFGELNIDDNDIIVFKVGIFGFEEYTKFIILKDAPDDNIFYLQSVENSALTFVLVDPYSVINEYNPIVSKVDMDELGVTSVDHLTFALIAIITKDVEKSVVNLKAPIVINSENKQAKQIVLDEQIYELRYPMFGMKHEEVL